MANLLLSLEGLLGVLASLQEIPGKLPHLEEENLPRKQLAICKTLHFIFYLFYFIFHFIGNLIL